MGVKNMVKKIADRSAGGISKLAFLSSDEIQKIESERNKYLFEMPKMDDELSLALTNRLLAASSVEIYNAYLPQLKTLYSPIQNTVEYDEHFVPGHNIRYINITKWVTNREENSIEKLINVYEVLSNENCNIALVFNRQRSKTNVYLAVVNTMNDKDNVDIDIYKKRIVDALKGNFPGSEYIDGGIGRLPCFKESLNYSVACASNVPAEKSEKFISQTIEKLLDGVIPENTSEEYTVVLLATPILDVEDRKLRLAELYTNLYPYASWQTDYHFTDMKAFGSSATVGINVGASAGSQKGSNSSLAQGFSDSRQKTISNQETTTEGVSDNTSTFESHGEQGGFQVGVKHFNVNAGLNKNTGASKGKGESFSTAHGIANTLGRAVANTTSKTVGAFSSVNLGMNFGTNFARSSSVTATVGKNEGITQSYTNYTIKHTLELLEEQMKRYEQSVALGMWDFAAYIVSEDMNVANNVAHSYIALTQGEESYMSSASINLWRGDTQTIESQNAKEICDYIFDLRHPVFGLDPAIVEMDSTYYVYPPIVTATTALSGKELAYSLNFPKTSISGLPVLECTEFGRDISTYNMLESSREIRIGNIFHMNHEEVKTVELDLNSLASHTLITGSTGTGKSTTVYRILQEADKQDVNFLVIEPAKGEYKQIFGSREDVHVYGTNPFKTDLLRLNPFSFNKEIHVLEHIDRLIEIFNVCWPMYAAMPAVLKKAVELSYVDCGWDIKTSKNLYSSKYYPTFSDITRNVRNIINASEYDAENKGAYKGALLTRLESLTNGINGLIFTKNEIEDSELFDANVIVDLSRVGSMETKSLLMGILVLKLQEYRVSFSGMNEELKHITVLEEAHNLLKRTSTQQVEEGSNLLGKSVEMISNAIAEMRTYGEGFIIADQAPALLDLSSIRNTNTKIIMRLPDQSDRELVGRAANLNDDQITELARLPRGVAAIYQNEWIEPILCKVKRTKFASMSYTYEPIENKFMSIWDEQDRYFIARLISRGDSLQKEVILKDVVPVIEKLPVDDSIKVMIIKWISRGSKTAKMSQMAPLMTALYPEIKAAIDLAFNESNDSKDWELAASHTLYTLNEIISGQLRRDIIQCSMFECIYVERNEPLKYRDWAQKGGLA